MATIIEELLVTLGLDVIGIKKGEKEVVESFDNVEEASDKARKATEVNGKKMGNAIYAVRNQVLGLMAAFTAGAGMKSFFQSTTNADAATGRLAKNIGTSVEQLTAWQNVAERSGGSAEGIAGTMQGLTTQFQQLALTGQSDVIPYFRTVGVAIADLSTGKMRPLNDILLDLSDRFSKMDPRQAQALGRGMGIDEGTINVLIRGRKAIQELLREQEKLGHANKRDTDEAIRRQEAFRRLTQVSEDLGRKFLTLLTPAILVATAALESLGKWFQEHPDAATAAIGTMTTAIIGLSAALSVGAVAAFGKFALAGVSAFASVLLAAAPFIAVIAAVAAGGYGIYKAYAWAKEKSVEEAESRGVGPSSKLPRGVRNNNPGNLNYAGQAGAELEGGPNGRFAVFKTMQEGIIALAKQLERYGDKGVDSIREIISKYAPEGENNTKAYIEALARKLGVDPNARLNVKDEATMRALIEGISTIEVGKGHINQEQINQALNARNRSAASSSINSRAETHIGHVTINTAATDAQGIASAFVRGVEKYNSTAAMANYGLA